MTAREVQADANTLLETAFVANAADLLSYFGRRVRVSADAADLLGETFLVAARRVQRMPPTAEEGRMWLFGIARRVLANSNRSTARHASLVAKLQERLRALPADQPDAEALDIRAALDALPPSHSELIRLVLWDGFTVPEAAAILGISESTARGRYQRARAKLAAMLSEHRYERISE